MKFVFSSVNCCLFFISLWLLVPLSQGAAVPAPLPQVCIGENAVEANPVDCSTFYKCVNGVSTLTACPLHLEFHEEWKVCTWQEQANCTRNVTVTDNGSGDQNSSNSDGESARRNNATSPVGQPFTIIFDKYFPQLKEWEQKISNTTLLNIAGEPQPKAVIEADVIIFRNSTAIYKRKIQIHSAEKLENSTVVANMLGKYTVSCAILNLKYRMVDGYPEPPPWCLPHLVNKVASASNLHRAYNFLNHVSDYYHKDR